MIEMENMLEMLDLKWIQINFRFHFYLREMFIYLFYLYWGDVGDNEDEYVDWEAKINWKEKEKKKIFF